MLDLIRDEPSIVRGALAILALVLAKWGLDLDSLLADATVILAAVVAIRQKVIPAHRARRVPK